MLRGLIPVSIIRLLLITPRMRDGRVAHMAHRRTRRAGRGFDGARVRAVGCKIRESTTPCGGIGGWIRWCFLLVVVVAPEQEPC